MYHQNDEPMSRPLAIFPNTMYGKFEKAHLDILMVMFLQHLQVCGQVGWSADIKVLTHDMKKNSSISS